MSTNTKPAPRKQPPNDVAVWQKPTNKAGLQSLMPGVIDSVEQSLPTFLRGQADRMIRAMITETSRSPKLMECTPLSLFGAVVVAGQLGLTIGAGMGECYLLPFWNKKINTSEATLIVGYRGYLQLIHRSGKVMRITPVVVRDGDRLEIKRGLRQDLSHIPKLGNENAKVVHYYVVIELINGGLDFEHFTVGEAIEHRDRYSTVKSDAKDWVKSNSPWYDIQGDKPGHGFNEMALKTLIRRISKRCPMSTDWQQACGLESLTEAGESQNLGQMLPVGREESPPFDEAAMLEQDLRDATEQPADGQLFNNQDGNLPD